MLLWAGVPRLLWIIAGTPIPLSWPTWQQIQTALLSPDDGSLLFGLLKYLAWGAWFRFTAATASELFIRITGKAASLPTRPGSVRKIARSLVIGATMASLSATASIRSDLSGASRPAVVATATDTSRLDGVYAVEPGDSLWTIAAHQLGDPRLWRQIWQLNAHRQHNDGRIFDDPALIRPGWHLHLPTQTGRPGRPDHGDRRDGHRPDAPPDPAQPHPSASPPPSPLPSPALSTRRSNTPPGHSATGNTPAPISTSVSATDQNRSADRPASPVTEDQAVSVFAVGALVGISFAAAAGFAVHLARLHARRHRTTPHPTAAPSPPNAPLPAPLPHLAHAQQRADPHATPDPDPLASAFTQHTNPPTPKADAQAARHHQPRPILIPPCGLILAQSGDQELRVDLGAAGGLGIQGPIADDVARAVLLGLLLRNPYEQVQVVTTADVASRLLADHTRTDADIAALPGLVVRPSLDQALAHLEAETVARLRLIDTAEVQDIVEHRRRFPAEAAPSLLLVADTPNDSHAARLATLTELGRPYDIAALILGPWPGGATCHTDPDGTVTSATGRVVPHLAHARLSHLPSSQITTMVQLIQAAHGKPTALFTPTPTPPPAPAGVPPATTRPDRPGEDLPRESHLSSPGTRRNWPPPYSRQVYPPPAPPPDPPTTPEAADPASQPDTAPTPASTAATGHDQPRNRDRPDHGQPPVQLRLFGRLRLLVGGQEIVTGLRADSRSLLALLALHPGGQSTEQIFAALRPDADPSSDIRRLYTAVTKARATLRLATTAGAEAGSGGGQAMFINHAAERYQLDPDLIGVDVWAFDHALASATRAVDTPTRITWLQRAAELYTGELLEQYPEPFADAARETTRRHAAEALTKLARLTTPTDPEAALAWYEKALEIDPYSEELFGELMNAQAALGHLDAVRRTYTRLKKAMAELDAEPSASTLELVRRLLTISTSPSPGPRD
jgi:DNA-binding SARP family transcriptional activator